MCVTFNTIEGLGIAKTSVHINTQIHWWSNKECLLLDTFIHFGKTPGLVFLSPSLFLPWRSNTDRSIINLKCGHRPFELGKLWHPVQNNTNCTLRLPQVIRNIWQIFHIAVWSQYRAHVKVNLVPIVCNVKRHHYIWLTKNLGTYNYEL